MSPGPISSPRDSMRAAWLLRCSKARCARSAELPARDCRASARPFAHAGYCSTSPEAPSSDCVAERVAGVAETITYPDVAQQCLNFLNFFASRLCFCKWSIRSRYSIYKFLHRSMRPACSMYSYCGIYMWHIAFVISSRLACSFCNMTLRICYCFECAQDCAENRSR
jgi:hypothetical protein